MIADTRKLRKAMHDIAAKKGDFTLFGIFRRTDAPGTWDLVVSAPWPKAGKLKALGDFNQLLAESIGQDALLQFARIVIIDPADPAIRSLTTAFSVDDGEWRVQGANWFGVDIEDGIIMRAKRAA